MNDMITVRNKETGEVGLISRRWYESPVINNGILEEVPPGTKSALPEMWKSKMAPVEMYEISTPDPDEEDEA